MDFIKTSSLRALIELTFQRNWNGLIWMSRKGVTTKRVKTVQTALSRTAPNRAVRLAEERCSRSAKVSVRLKSRPKSKPLGRSRITTRETVPRSASHNRHATPRTTKAREPGKSLAAAQLASTDAPSEPGEPSRPAERFHRPNLSVRPAGRPNPSGPTVPTRPRPDVRPIVPTTVPTPRSTRSPFEAQISYFQARLNPKPPLERPSTIYIDF
ncbi:unnamed protein product [Microthlaspi erraticum]|uniref:Uncharacterized protein n=1 Tax=Microthlaspi erraticum TaxID=1685480 RepID=A0A6D2KAG9_9BRAS|nr:unnamed protein product [Microthlaspi erraticum]